MRVRISRGALGTNAPRAARAAGPDAVADLRRDAWGHGVAVVASALAGAGVRAACVDDCDEPAVAAAGLSVVESAPTLDASQLYGFPGSDTAPVMALVGSVLSIKPLLAGEGVSYSYTHRAPRDTRIALVAGGYGQGVVRAIGNHVSVEVAGRLCPVVGRVAMDVCVVDVGDGQVRVGDEVVYFGGDGPARFGLAEWERATGLAADELACAIGLRVERMDAS